MSNFIRNELVCIIGPSGSGKDTLQNLLCSIPLQSDKQEEFSYLKPIISYTTRPRRKGERDTHQFTNPEVRPDKKDMIAYTLYNGYEYWATYQQANDCDVYIIDPQGLETLISTSALTPKKLFVVYLQVHWWLRFWRVAKRNSVFYAIKRLIADHKHFKNCKDYSHVVLKNNNKKQLRINCTTILQHLLVSQPSLVEQLKEQGLKNIEK